MSEERTQQKDLLTIMLLVLYEKDRPILECSEVALTLDLGRVAYKRSSTGIQTDVMRTIAIRRNFVTESKMNRARIATRTRRIEKIVAFRQTSDADVIRLTAFPYCIDEISDIKHILQEPLAEENCGGRTVRIKN